jgi:hypothetical protein
MKFAEINALIYSIIHKNIQLKDILVLAGILML